eukprot:SAG11_NODE_1442_length_4901_cov_2.114952_1_plen_44_part_00
MPYGLIPKSVEQQHLVQALAALVAPYVAIRILLAGDCDSEVRR